MMWQLNRKSAQPLFQQIVTQIINYIQDGTLEPGSKLPPERKLATYYQVNRSTVNHALDELVSLGWIIRQQGSGTKVASNQLGIQQNSTDRWRRLLPKPFFKPDPYLEQITELRMNPMHNQTLLDLQTGDLPLELILDFQFPAISWEQVIKEEQKISATGYAPLQKIILEQLATNFNISATKQTLLLTSGSTQGISLLLQTLLQPGDWIATEEPSFLFTLPIFQSQGIALKGIPCDDEGIIVSELEQAILRKNIKLLYLNPTFQNPTGRSMSLARRYAILALCKKYYVPIIEDDVFAELNFDSAIPKLKTLDTEQVIYLGSLSKIFSSSIKIGWLLAPNDLGKRLTLTKRRNHVETNIFPQLLATAALCSQDYHQQQQILLKQLQKKSTLFQKALAPLTDYWSYEDVSGGLYYWLTWQGENLQRKDWQHFLSEQLLVAPSFLFSSKQNACRINYTHLTKDNYLVFQKKLTTITQKLLQKEQKS